MKKKKKNLKTQNKIASTQNRVLKNTKLYQAKVEMQCKKNKIKNLPKNLGRKKGK